MLPALMYLDRTTACATLVSKAMVLVKGKLGSLRPVVILVTGKVARTLTTVTPLSTTAAKTVLACMVSVKILAPTSSIVNASLAGPTRTVTSTETSAISPLEITHATALPPAQTPPVPTVAGATSVSPVTVSLIAQILAIVLASVSTVSALILASTTTDASATVATRTRSATSTSTNAPTSLMNVLRMPHATTLTVLTPVLATMVSKATAWNSARTSTTA